MHSAHHQFNKRTLGPKLSRPIVYPCSHAPKLPTPTISQSSTSIQNRSHQNTLIAPRRLTRILRLLHLPNHQLKSLSNVLIVLCTCFRPSTVEFLSELLAFLCCDLALVWTEIGLVAYYYYRDPICALTTCVSRTYEEGE